ncbi:radical SAM protein [Desulfococcaceae bacterium OttesenSCG-928-F15]|nr:radical SAM protein [Desulfococcaceae bacterium OttesenSCG-928-F15]
MFPNTYALATANLGFQTVYSLFNAMDLVSCERIVMPEKAGETVKSLESGLQLSSFDILAFSLSFENDYPRIPEMLHSAGIPFFRNKRKETHPLIMAGGIATFLNPEPVADFFDLFLVGEAEVLTHSFFDLYLRHMDLKKSELCMTIASSMEGVYAPEFYHPIRNTDGRILGLSAEAGLPQRIRKVSDRDIGTKITASPILSPSSAFPNTFLVEVSRGCPHGCRFCSAGFVYRPPRFREPEILEKAVAMGRERGAKIGLLGTSVSDFKKIDGICEQAKENELVLSFSSLRADGLSPALLKALEAGKVQTATIAPEAGSERLRKVINKGLSEKSILDAAEKLVEAGIPNLKLYFMIGLPEEEEEDLQAIKDLVLKIKDRFLEASRKKGYMGDITLGVSPFVPKPFTPFQWSAMEDEKKLSSALADFRKSFAPVPNIRFHAENPKSSVIQAILARGDRDVSQLIAALWQSGGKLGKALALANFDPAPYLKERSLKDWLPWEIIDHGLKRSFLENEFLRSQQAKSSPACPMKACETCGICREEPNSP